MGATNVTNDNAHEFEVHQFITEASQLGLVPGEWPTFLSTDLGNGRPFVKQYWTGEGTVLYRQEFGCITLKVLNT